VTIENLITVVPPPAAPFGAYSGPWEPIEAQLGTPLPNDYKDFVRLYGHGDLMGFIGIHVPASWSPYMRLVQEAWAIATAFKDDESLPLPMWPNPGGLLPFGKTDLGDTLFWLTRGAPADWQVVVMGRDPPETFDCDMTDFLARVAKGEISAGNFPDDLEPGELVFEPSPSETSPRRLRLLDGNPTGDAFTVSWRFGPFGTDIGVSTCRLRDDPLGA
jgi:hypothetical protein